MCVSDGILSKCHNVKELRIGRVRIGNACLPPIAWKITAFCKLVSLIKVNLLSHHMQIKMNSAAGNYETGNSVSADAI